MKKYFCALFKNLQLQIAVQIWAKDRGTAQLTLMENYIASIKNNPDLKDIKIEAKYTKIYAVEITNDKDFVTYDDIKRMIDEIKFIRGGSDGENS